MQAVPAIIRPAMRPFTLPGKTTMYAAVIVTHTAIRDFNG